VVILYNTAQAAATWPDSARAVARNRR